MITHDFKARVRSYELLAQAFALEPRERSGGRGRDRGGVQ
jgi:hypothetical protein